MLLPVAVASPRHLSPDAPACQPCPPLAALVPVAPPPPVTARRFTMADFTRAASRCQELHQQHPSWPGSRVRAQAARELSVSTVTLRYLLRRAAEALAAPESPTTALAA